MYVFGHTEVVFDMETDTPIMISVMGVFSRVSDGSQSGKISVMTIDEDHVPFLQEMQDMMQ